jgi:hypothetical protein
MYNQTPYYHKEKPTAAFALSLVAGIFILLGGLLFAVIPTIIGVGLSFIPGLGGVGATFIIFGVLGIVWGILVLVGAIMMNSGDVSKVRIGGALVLVFSLLSWFGAIAGFFIGLLLGLIGAIMGLAWHPSMPQQMQQPMYGPQPVYGQQQTWGPQPTQQPQQQIKRICPQCGRVIGEDVKFCPNCGKQLG